MNDQGICTAESCTTEDAVCDGAGVCDGTTCVACQSGNQDNCPEGYECDPDDSGVCVVETTTCSDSDCSELNITFTCSANQCVHQTCEEATQTTDCATRVCNGDYGVCAKCTTETES